MVVVVVVVLLFDFLLQITCFVSLMTLDARRMEVGGRGGGDRERGEIERGGDRERGDGGGDGGGGGGGVAV